MESLNVVSDNEATRLANAFASKYVHIVCHPNRYLSVEPAASNSEREHDDTEKRHGTVKTVTNRELATCVVIERLTVDEELRFGKSGLVSFRAVTQAVEPIPSPPTRYLTIELYGDEVRQAATEALVSASTEMSSVPLLPEHIGVIIDYAFGSGTAESNFEGAGYDYSPLTAPCSVPGKRPNMMQVFQLTSEPGGNSYGVKSLFNTFWRSQHWSGVVSQSPHCLADEIFIFRDAQQRDGERMTMRDW